MTDTPLTERELKDIETTFPSGAVSLLVAEVRRLREEISDFEQVWDETPSLNAMRMGDKLRALAARVTDEMLHGVAMFSRPACRRAHTLLRDVREAAE